MQNVISNILVVYKTYAAEPLSNLNNELGNSSYFTKLNPFVGNLTTGQIIDLIITILLYTAGILATIYLLWAGMSYITAGGDENKAVKARTGIINAIIGIIIILLSFVAEKAVARIFGGNPAATATTTASDSGSLPDTCPTGFHVNYNNNTCEPD